MAFDGEQRQAQSRISLQRFTHPHFIPHLVPQSTGLAILSCFSDPIDDKANYQQA